MKKSFTLVELLIVLVVIGALVTLAVPQYHEMREKTLVTEVITLADAIRKAENAYFQQHGVYLSGMELDRLMEELGFEFSGLEDSPEGSTGREGEFGQKMSKYWYYSVGFEVPSGETSQAILKAERRNGKWRKTWIMFNTVTEKWTGTHPFTPD